MTSSSFMHIFLLKTYQNAKELSNLIMRKNERFLFEITNLISHSRHQKTDFANGQKFDDNKGIYNACNFSAN